MSHLSTYERLPVKVVEAVEINQEMKDGIIDPQIMRWFDPDFLIRHAAVFAFAKQEGELILSQSPRMGRDVILERSHYYTDEYDNPFTMITAKGTGVSLASLAQDPSARYGSDPSGLFGEIDAEKEMIASNGIAQEGGRVGRVIATLTLNHQHLLKMSSYYENESQISLHKEIGKVERHRDTAAICVRLQAGGRLLEYADKRQGRYSPRALARDSISLMLAEIDRKTPRGFADQYKFENPLTIQQSLQALLGSDATTDDLLRYGEILLQMYSLTHLYKDRVFDPRTGNAIRKQFRSHDYDLAGYTYDWELTMHGSSTDPFIDYDDSHFEVPFLSPQENDYIRERVSESLAALRIEKPAVLDREEEIVFP